MKIGVGFENTQKEIFAAKVDPRKAHFRISSQLLRRIIINALVFVPVGYVAYYFEQIHMLWFTVMWGGGITLWQVFAYGFFGADFSGRRMEVTNFYSKGTLVFAAIMWSLIIAGVALALYFKAP
jgi:hypothetical protein